MILLNIMWEKKHFANLPPKFKWWFRKTNTVIYYSYRATFIIKDFPNLHYQNSCTFSAEFSSSRNRARIAIWFSLSLRASRDLLAASLFLHRLAQYLLFLSSSGTNCFFRFLKKISNLVFTTYKKQNQIIIQLGIAINKGLKKTLKRNESWT